MEAKVQTPASLALADDCSAHSSVHTPFCEKECTVSHHDLVRALFLEDNRTKASKVFKDCVFEYRAKGWKKNSAVPDDLEKLQLPLIHLASAFGRYRLVDYLIEENFSPTSRNKDGDTALHAALRHLYGVGRSGQFKWYVGVSKRLDVFKHTVNSLSRKCPQIFALKNFKGETVLHLAARLIVTRTCRSPRTIGRPLNMPPCTYYENCLKIMLQQLHALEGYLKLTRRDVMSATHSQDEEGNTIFHILACCNTIQCRSALEYALHISREPPTTKNNHSKTALDLVSAFLGPGEAKELFNVRATGVRPTDLSLSPIAEVDLPTCDDGWLEYKAGSECLEAGGGSPVTKQETLEDSKDGYSLEHKEPLLDEEQFDFSANSIESSENCNSDRSVSLSKDDSFLQFVISEGAELDKKAKNEVLGIFLQQYKNKLNEIEAVNIPKLDQEIVDNEADLRCKRLQLEKAEEDLCMLKNDVQQREVTVKDLSKRRKSLRKEGNSLKRRISLCLTTEQEINAKKERLE